MGHKVHPIGFRLGIIKDWQARWFEPKASSYRETLQEDLKIRHIVFERYPDAGVSRVEIERNAGEIRVIIHTARPGIVIGRGGQRVDELRALLEAFTGKRVHIVVQDIPTPELDAYLVARNIAEQLERRVSYRRAMLQAASRAMQAGAKGVKIICSGRLAGAEIARREKVMMGRVPLHTLRADIDFATTEAVTQMGTIGVKVWIYKGDVMPAREEAPEEEIRPLEVSVQAEEERSDVATEEGSVS